MTSRFSQIEAITRAAKARNRKVIVHVAQIGETVRTARMGVDGFAHLWSYGESATDEQRRVLKDAGVFIIPTVLLQQRAWQTIERDPNGQHPSGASSPAELPIIAGTDARNFGVNYTDGRIEELAIYARAGLRTRTSPVRQRHAGSAPPARWHRTDRRALAGEHDPAGRRSAEERRAAA